MKDPSLVALSTDLAAHAEALWPAVDLAIGAGLGMIAMALVECARRACIRDRRRQFETVAIMFVAAAVTAVALVAMQEAGPAARVAIAVIGAAAFVGGAFCLRRVLLELAPLPSADVLATANTRLSDELARRAASESDLLRKREELLRANETLNEAAAALRASEERLAIAVEAGRIGLWDWNIKSGETWNSPQWRALLGRPGDRADQGFETWRAAVEADEAARVRAAIVSHLQSGTPFNPIFKVTLPGGDSRWLEATGRAQRDADGAPVRMAGALIDITEDKRTQDALMRREAFERAVLEAVGDAIVACDETGRLVLFNSAALEFHGIDTEPASVEDLPKYYDLFAPDGRSQLPPQDVPLARALKGETVTSAEIVIAPNGRPPRRVLTHAAPLIDRLGRPIGAVAAMRDVTRERAALAELARKTRELELIFNSVPVELWYLTESREIRRANAEAAASLGLAAAELEGRRIDDFPGAERLLGPKSTDAFDASPVEEHQRPDGAPRWLKTHRISYADEETGEQLLFVAATDITQTMLAKQELRRSNEELDQFARAASHDLREPLRKILFFSDVLQRDLEAQLPAQAKADLNVIADAARRMEALIRGFLSLARIGAGVPVLAPTDPKACIEAALSQLHVPPTRAVRFNYQSLPPVLADRELLVQVFQNLIANALKFAQPEGTVEIAFTGAAAGGDAILGVADNGIGVPADARKVIFEPLTRLHSSQEFEGAGIGLALCRKSIERLGGSIWVEESAAGGAHFRLKLRRAA